MDFLKLRVAHTDGPPYRYELYDGDILFKRSTETFRFHGDSERAAIAEKVRLDREQGQEPIDS